MPAMPASSSPVDRPRRGSVGLPPVSLLEAGSLHDPSSKHPASEGRASPLAGSYSFHPSTAELRSVSGTRQYDRGDHTGSTACDTTAFINKDVAAPKARLGKDMDQIRCAEKQASVLSPQKSRCSSWAEEATTPGDTSTLWDHFLERTTLDITDQEELDQIVRKKQALTRDQAIEWRPIDILGCQLNNKARTASTHSSQPGNNKDANEENTKSEDQSFVSEVGDAVLSEMEKDIMNGDTPPRTFTIDDFDIGRPLGKGKFGNVYLARDRLTNFIVAIKIMYKSQLHKHHVVENLRRELLIQAHIRHENVLRLYCFFWDEQKIYVVLEAANRGELYAVLSRYKRLPEPMAASYIEQMIRAIQACHRKHIIHRDIKPENILLSKTADGRDILKLADFGWSVHLRTDFERRETMCGTLDYISPEMVKKEKHSFGVDVWALGILLYEFLAGKPPFERRATEQQDEAQRTFQSILEEDVVFPDEEDEESGEESSDHVVSEDAKDLIRKFLTKKPEDRIRLEDALKHPFLKKGEMLNKVSGASRRSLVVGGGK